jgi:hypothetical protein
VEKIMKGDACDKLDEIALNISMFWCAVAELIP